MRGRERSEILAWIGRSMVIAGAVVVVASSIAAESGVVFDNIGQGLDYRRAPAANFPQLVALLEGSLVGDGLAFATIPERLPGRSRGIPGVAVFDYDQDGDLDI